MRVQRDGPPAAPGRSRGVAVVLGDHTCVVLHRRALGVVPQGLAARASRAASQCPATGRGPGQRVLGVDVVPRLQLAPRDRVGVVEPHAVVGFVERGEAVVDALRRGRSAGTANSSSRVAAAAAVVAACAAWASAGAEGRRDWAAAARRAARPTISLGVAAVGRIGYGPVVSARRWSAKIASAAAASARAAAWSPAAKASSAAPRGTRHAARRACRTSCRPRCAARSTMSGHRRGGRSLRRISAWSPAPKSGIAGMCGQRRLAQHPSRPAPSSMPASVRAQARIVAAPAAGVADGLGLAEAVQRHERVGQARGRRRCCRAAGGQRDASRVLGAQHVAEFAALAIALQVLAREHARGEHVLHVLAGSALKERDGRVPRLPISLDGGGRQRGDRIGGRGGGAARAQVRRPRRERGERARDQHRRAGEPQFNAGHRHRGRW